MTLERLRELGMPLEERAGRRRSTHRRAGAAARGTSPGPRRVCRRRSMTPSTASSTRAAGATCRARGSARARRSRRSAAPAACPVLAHSPDAADRPEVIDELQAWGLAGLEVYYRTFAPETVRTDARVRPGARSACHRRQRLPWRHDELRARRRPPPTCPPPVGEALLEAIAARRVGARERRARDRPRCCRRCSTPGCRRRAATAPAPRRCADARLAEFVTDDVVLPRFHVWTLGCQMNHSDSEEMAGALLAAGCSEAPAWSRPSSSSSTAAPSARRRSRRSSAGWGPWPAQGGQPGLRVVLTGLLGSCRQRRDR